MTNENRPIKPIPLPDYAEYRATISATHNLDLPLKTIPAAAGGLLKSLPAPLHKQGDGWPWTTESAVAFQASQRCPKISVVVPSYNQGVFIEETIRSVILQNYPNLELIIMDGGSTDDTIKVTNHYRDFISLIISEPDRGQSHAINKGFSVADGELYFWLNSDDYVTINSFNRLVAHFNANPKLDIAYGHGLVVDETSTVTFEYAPLVKSRYLRFGGIVLSHAVMWRKRVHQPIWEDLQCAMDAELWLRLFPGSLSKHVQFPVGVFRKHSQQKTSLASMSKKWERDFREYIWPHYTPISAKKWQRREREFGLIQKIYRLFHPYFYKP